ncbi:sigma-54 interaction domain-containing protein [Chlorobium phaeovibrioides]|uniref:Sigma-54-dependent Fis family transcriptional regulator n=1 Tax=Chlorobium phaeovibrioides TaxID=1094 RepID=A0A3S0L630_CHLPH|nr:sigma-54 dependent transcriptional regulator [Chlorobium phaeovibrioides]MWV53949.1 sigma-54-dependent Fis family transcriptional regulator [Chlorobium phaeovibrioides]QEQ56649.1 sigma-54-dependent Fis family transcriptional regulator [Chlorobium phaeovibrioides]RTY38842.1 sigma-54-dependent Fis family transcriptional regulator [Chlorobium phaeovibrioides]
MKPDTVIIGASDVMERLRQFALQVAETDITVLITGETGSGKEVLARFIHNHSRRAGKSFIPVNCGAIPTGILESELFGHEKGAFTGAVQARKGYFETADRGSIFLDEIGEMSLETQVKFLRVIENGEFQRVGASSTIYSDTRIIAATNKNLMQAVAEHNFREDLYYRLRSVELQIPPLRERGRDILLLTEHFVHEFQQKHTIPFEGFTPDATEMLLRYPWPGNVRELRNLVESLLVLEKGREITSGILDKHLIQRNRFKSLVHDPVRSEKNELQLLYSSLIQLRQEVSDIRHMVQQLMEPDRPLHTAPLLLPDPSENTEPPSITEPGPAPAPPSLDEAEKKTIIEAINRCGGNKKKAAAALGTTERTLYRKIKRYGL